MTQMPFKLLLPKDQSPLPLMLLDLPCNSTSVVSSSTSAEPASITVSSLSDTELKDQPTTGSSRTPGVQDGEKKVSSESSEPKERRDQVSAVSNLLLHIQ